MITKVLPLEILHKILNESHSDPYKLIELEHLNQTFRTVISDNALWKRYNPSSLLKDHYSKDKNNSSVANTSTLNLRSEFKKRIEALSPEARTVLRVLWRENPTKAYVLNAVKSFPKSWDIANAAINHESMALLYASPEVKSDPDIIRRATEKNPQALGLSTNILLFDDFKLVLSAVSRDGTLLSIASNRLKDHPDIVLAAIKNAPDSLSSASLRLQNDKPLVFQAVRREGTSVAFSTEALRDNKKIILEAIKNNPRAIQYASVELRQDPEIALEAVRRDGMMLEFSHGIALNNREIVATAVQQNGEALIYAPLHLRSDREIVQLAVKQNGMSIFYADEKFLNDPEMVTLATHNNTDVAEMISNQKSQNSGSFAWER